MLHYNKHQNNQRGAAFMEQQSRKLNRLENYNYSQNGAYFITICTQDRKSVLSAIAGDAFPVPSPVGEIAEEYIRRISDKYPEVMVDQYVIMPDHIHLLLCIDGTGKASPEIGNVIGWYKYQVTKQANLLLNTPGGKLFQRSYYDHVIRNQQDYDEIRQYIKYNPLKLAMKP